MYRLLAQLNKRLLPSFTRRRLDLTKATRWQKALLAWRYYVTIRALSEEAARHKKNPF